MNEYIDIYCERLEPGLLAEPLNALSNLAFFVAAFMAFRLARSEKALDWRSTILIGLIAVIGTGSTLFHTFATQWALLSDVLPILIYQIAFLGFYVRQVLKWRAAHVVGFLALFFLSIYGAGQLPQGWLNGSIGYAPALMFLSILSAFHYLKQKREPFMLMLATGAFLLSLTARSFDMSVCAALPLGTHFAWHLLNGCLLYCTARAYILNAK